MGGLLSTSRSFYWLGSSSRVSLPCQLTAPRNRCICFLRRRITAPNQPPSVPPKWPADIQMSIPPAVLVGNSLLSPVGCTLSGRARSTDSGTAFWIASGTIDLPLLTRDATQSRPLGDTRGKATDVACETFLSCLISSVRLMPADWGSGTLLPLLVFILACAEMGIMMEAVGGEESRERTAP